jgi:ABC-type glycerol-3-phosphate transport system substrate-binding protein
MIAQSTDNLLRLRQFGWTFDVAPMPDYKQKASLLNAEQICLLHYGKQKDAAWEYLKFAASPDEQAIMAKAFGQTPPYKSQFDAWAKTADATQGLKGAPLIADVLKYAKPLPIEVTIKFSDLQALWEQKIIGAPLLNQCGGRSAKDAYDQFVRDGNVVMGQISWGA